MRVNTFLSIWSVCVCVHSPSSSAAASAIAVETFTCANDCKRKGKQIAKETPSVDIDHEQRNELISYKQVDKSMHNNVCSDYYNTTAASAVRLSIVERVCLFCLYHHLWAAAATKDNKFISMTACVFKWKEQTLPALPVCYQLYLNEKQTNGRQSISVSISLALHLISAAKQSFTGSVNESYSHSLLHPSLLKSLAHLFHWNYVMKMNLLSQHWPAFNICHLIMKWLDNSIELF